MKAMKYLLVASLICLAYWCGRMDSHSCHERDYQAACVLNDCCRNMVDNLGVDAEEIYCEYVDNLDCDPKLMVTKEDIKEYAWSY